jgi:hypothetical protein
MNTANTLTTDNIITANTLTTNGIFLREPVSKYTIVDDFDQPFLENLRDYHTNKKEGPVILRQLPDDCFNDLERLDVVSLSKNSKSLQDQLFIEQVKEAYKYICQVLQYETKRIQLSGLLNYPGYSFAYHYEVYLAVAKLLHQDGLRITMNDSSTLYIEYDEHLPILKYAVDSKIYNEGIM